MDDIQNAERGFFGTISGIQFMDFVQLACLARWNQTIRVISDSGFGRTYIRTGQIFHAEFADLSGEEALVRMLQWESGRFEASPLEEVDQATITRSWEYLLIEALRSRGGGQDSGGEGAAPVTREKSHGFEGTINGIDSSDLIQLTCMTRKDYLLTIESNRGTGRVHVRSGQVCHAEFSDLRGEDAFNEIVAGESGRFECLAPSGEVPVTIEKPWEYLLIDAMRYHDELAGATKGEEEAAEEAENLFQRLQKMKVAEKIRLAMTGDKEARSLLVRDSNRLVQLAIVSNGRITEGEVAAIASSRSVDEEVLRRISANREWTKNYAIRLALATNPKTPMPIATRLVPTLIDKDLKLIAKSKSVPMVVASAARRLIVEKR